MNTLAIDIETYSDLDLKKVGGYKYAENCEILLFGYAFNDDPVKVIDLTKMDLPEELKKAIQDPTITKTAYNAQFERTVLSNYLKLDHYLPPEQWACTMVLSLTVGMPGSLEKDSKVLNLSPEEAKLPIGKSLIQYFSKPCRPTKTNDSRTRNLPKHAPERWAQFIKYNQRDVETERIIRRKMQKFIPSNTEQMLYTLDQQINDRGVMIDTNLVNSAIAIDADFKSNVIGQKPVVEFLGPDLDSVKFKMIFSIAAGIADPEDEINKLREMMQTGEAAYLILNGKPMSDYKFIIESISETVKAFNGNGKIISASVDVSAKEYVEDLPVIANAANGTEENSND